MTSNSLSRSALSGVKIRRVVPVLALLAGAACGAPITRPSNPKEAFIRVGPEIREASDLNETLEPYRAELKAQFSRTLAQCPSGLDRSRPDIPLGQWFTDVLRARARAQLGRDVDLAITNAGGLRIDLPPGAVTLRHIYEIFPFENTLVVGELKGRDLQRFALELATTGEPFSGMRIQVSGPQSAPILEKLELENGTPVEPEKTYLIATSDYLIVNGDRTPTMRTLRNAQYLGITLRQIAIDAVEDLGRRGMPVELAPSVRLKRPSDWNRVRSNGAGEHR